MRCHFERGVCEIVRSGRVNVVSFGVTRITGIRISRQQIARGKFFEQLDHCVRPVQAIRPDNLRPELATTRKCIDQRHARLQASFRLASEQRNNHAIALRARAQRDLHFLEIHERFEKNKIDIRLEQRGNLLAEYFSPINAAFLGLVRADPKRADASRHTNISTARCPLRDPHRLLVDFRDAMFKSKSRQTHRIRAERIRLYYARAGCDVFVMDCADPVRLAYAEFFQAAIYRHAAIEQQRSHRAVAAYDSQLKFLQQIHGVCA